MNRKQKRNREAGFRILGMSNEKRKAHIQQIKLNAYLKMMSEVAEKDNKETATLEYIQNRLSSIDKLSIEATHLLHIKESILLERIK